MTLTDGIPLGYSDTVVHVIKQNSGTYLIFTANGHIFEVGLGLSYDSKYNYVQKIC